MMREKTAKQIQTLLLQKDLKPLVRKIDMDHYYPKDFLSSLGEAGYFSSDSMEEKALSLREFQLLEEVSKICMTTGFILWCHMMALTYLRNSDNQYLTDNILPKLEDGSILAGTGLSNPIKFYAEIEKLHLKAERTEGGYILSGALPSVSNLDKGHWFGAVAETDNNQRLMLFISCDTDGLSLKTKSNYMGINGSATYACRFNKCFIPKEWIVSEDADAFIEHIRPKFLMHQIPLGLGIIDASIQSINKAHNKQRALNSYLPVQAEELENELMTQRQSILKYLESSIGKLQWQPLVQFRLDVTYLTLKAANANMIHSGGAGYMNISNPARRLREAYFFVNLTPTLKHLEKIRISS